MNPWNLDLDVNAHGVHAILDDRVERAIIMFTDIMLVLADANRFRLDLARAGWPDRLLGQTATPRCRRAGLVRQR